MRSIGGFLGSYFADGDEAQLDNAIDLYDKNEPAKIVNVKQLKGEALKNEKWSALHLSLPSLDEIQPGFSMSGGGVLMKLMDPINKSAAFTKRGTVPGLVSIGHANLSLEISTEDGLPY